MLKRIVRSILGASDDRQQTSEGLQCLTCGAPLAPLSQAQNGLLRCPTCSGTWLTSEALKSVLEEAAASESEAPEAVSGDGEADIGHTFAPSRTKRGCPVCHSEMLNHKFEESGVWVDTCEAGHGIWLDKGELKLLARRSRSRPNQVGDCDRFEDAVADLLIDIL